MALPRRRIPTLGPARHLSHARLHHAEAAHEDDILPPEEDDRLPGGLV